MDKESACNTGDTGDCEFHPQVGNIPWKRKCKPIQYSCLENAMDRGAWLATVFRTAKSRTWLKWLSMHTYTYKQWCLYWSIFIQMYLLYKAALVYAMHHCESAMCVHTCLPPELPGHLSSQSTPSGHHRVPSWAPCAVEQLPTSDLVHTGQCVYVNTTINSCKVTAFFFFPFLNGSGHMYW